MKKLNILDWYVHQGNQYEFFKTGHNFCLTNIRGGLPNWNKSHRPLNPNVKLIELAEAKKDKFDIVMIRNGVNESLYDPFLKSGSKPLVVIQTTTPFKFSKSFKNIIWNSQVVMDKYKKDFVGKNNYYIVHGFDPDEFKNINLKRNNRVLSICNSFKVRREFTGFDLWNDVVSDLNVCDLVGDGNNDIDPKITIAQTFDDLLKLYNSYSIYFNPTNSSAMPRSRGEALMCGTPLVTTNNYDIGNYLRNGKDCFFANSKSEVIFLIKKILSSKTLQADLSSSGRDVAIKHFNIKDYITKWNTVLDKL